MRKFAALLLLLALAGFPGLRGEEKPAAKPGVDPRLRKALERSLLFPGLGQLYEKQFAKAAVQEPLPQGMVRARAQELKELGIQMKQAYRDRCRGKVFSGILIEENPNYALVVTRNFLSVRVPPVRGFKKKQLLVRVERVVNENLCEGQIA